MSCQNSLYVLQALVIVNLLACSFNFFFFNPTKEKRQRGKGVKGKEGRLKKNKRVREFSYLRKFQLIMLWKIAGEKIHLFNVLQ